LAVSILGETRGVPDSDLLLSILWLFLSSAAFFLSFLRLKPKVKIMEREDKFLLCCEAHGKLGYYSSGTFLGLIFLVIKHRSYHFVTLGKWTD